MIKDRRKETAAGQIAQALLSIGAVKLQPEKPFTWASGWKSPIYCDNRLTLSFPEIRTLIKDALVQLIKIEYPLAEGIAGVATAGIPQGVLVAEALNLPFLYVRPKPKDHGMSNLIEGKITPGQKVVVIEDLVSTGGSSLKAVEALREAKLEVLGMAAIFAYGFPEAAKNFRSANVSLSTLSDYDTLISTGLEGGFIEKEQIDSLQAWRQKPSEWMK